LCWQVEDFLRRIAIILESSFQMSVKLSGLMW